ncbi:7763_t:CDS:2, partial [Dentiscutata erythropus]
GTKNDTSIQEASTTTTTNTTEQKTLIQEIESLPKQEVETGSAYKRKAGEESPDDEKIPKKEKKSKKPKVKEIESEIGSPEKTVSIKRKRSGVVEDNDNKLSADKDKPESSTKKTEKSSKKSKKEKAESVNMNIDEDESMPEKKK